MDKTIRQRKKRVNKRTVRDSVCAFLNDYKATHPCEKCGETRIYCLVFHHRDLSKKKFKIAEHARDKPFADILEEIKKCEVLCANCHLEYHALNRMQAMQFEAPERVEQMLWK